MDQSVVQHTPPWLTQLQNTYKFIYCESLPHTIFAIILSVLLYISCLYLFSFSGLLFINSIDKFFHSAEYVPLLELFLTVFSVLFPIWITYKHISDRWCIKVFWLIAKNYCCVLGDRTWHIILSYSMATFFSSWACVTYVIFLGEYMYM